MNRIKRFWKRAVYKVMVEGWSWKYEPDKNGDGTSWRRIKVLGCSQQVYSTGYSYDCSGQIFCWGVDSYLFGLVTVGCYGIDC